jgi:hypothetical protein
LLLGSDGGDDLHRLLAGAAEGWVVEPESVTALMPVAPPQQRPLAILPS